MQVKSQAAGLHCLAILGPLCLAVTTWFSLASMPRSAWADDGDCPLVSCLTGSCFVSDCGGQQGNHDQKDIDNGDDKEESKCCYGPCDCQPRKTLLQWSYGTTFSGGPPAMDEPLESDRPDFTESPLTVGRGVHQLETGYDYTLDNAAGTQFTQHSFPQTLWRIGMLADWFEFRIYYNYEIDNFQFPSGARQHFQGSDDLELGAKICLTPQEGILPAMGIIPAMTVPSGSPDITEGEVMPSFIWAYSWDLNKMMSLGMSTDIERQRDDAGNIFTEFGQSISMDYKFTKHWGGYTEWVVFAPSGHTVERTQHYADGGFTYLWTNNIQLDAEVGVGLNAAANNFFAGNGATLRF
ncbi:MAG TPA: transporter [Pirellulales bacterium]|nr:transporter [Pirellulales bacterium]